MARVSQEQVAQALRSLCEAKGRLGLARVFFTAEHIAREAGCSVRVARKHLQELVHCAGYSTRRFGNKRGYRYSR